MLRATSIATAVVEVEAMPGDLFISKEALEELKNWLPSEQVTKEFFEKSTIKKLEEIKLTKGSQKTTEELKELCKKAIEELNGRSPAPNQ